MLKLTKFGQAEFECYPYVETLGGELVPMIGRAKTGPGPEGRFAVVVVDGNGIQVMIYNEKGAQSAVFCRELYPFPLAVFVAEHLEEPLDLKVLGEFGFEKFK